jgi:predicted ribosome quality control (RQC) complex YloA/Tae2 family protein
MALVGMAEAKNKFRRFTTRNEILVLAGKDAVSNEELIKQSEKQETILHTEAPGSPFVNLKGKPKIEDIEEAAVFCAKYSKEWKTNKKDVIVHVFKGKDVYKNKGMSTGTFGVKNFKIIKVKKSQIEKCQ